MAIALLLSLARPVAAQPAPDWIKITPPLGMRWKSLNQSPVTYDIAFVDGYGDTWLRKGAAATWAQTFVLVQLVGDTGGTDQWMGLVDAVKANDNNVALLRPDPDWSQPQYKLFTTNPRWRELIADQRVAGFMRAGSSGIPIAPTIVVPVYSSPSAGRLWLTPDDGPFPADAALTGEFRSDVPRVKAGVDTPYMVEVQDFSTNPPTVETRPGGYEIYRNYQPVFNPDGSLTLRLAGDFSFQKDYLFPTGGLLCEGLPRLPDGTCLGQPPIGTIPGAPAGDSPGPGTNPPPTSGDVPQPTLDNPPPVAQALPTLRPTEPLTAPAVPGGGCSGLPGAYIDLCGEARSRAAGLGVALPLPQLTLHANPTRGLVRVPTWLWADGDGYTGGPVSGVADVGLPWSHDWATCSTDEATGEQSCQHHHDEGTYHLSLTVRFQPGRYLWGFGDRHRLNTGSLGQAYPAESDVQHVYSDTSLGQPSNQYSLGLAIDWVGDWSVSGDAAGQGGLNPRRTEYTAPYVVRQAQAVGCAPDRC